MPGTARFTVVLLCTVCLASFAVVPDSRAENLPFTTIDIGGVSYYRGSDYSFTGADMIIRDQRTWGRFWKLHKEFPMPPVPVPEVDFREELVVVTILGWQSTMGPLTEILGISWNGDTGRLKVTVLDDTTPGMLPATSNPYHIIRVARRPFRSVDFEHEKEWTPPGFAVPAE